MEDFTSFVPSKYLLHGIMGSTKSRIREISSKAALSSIEWLFGTLEIIPIASSGIFPRKHPRSVKLTIYFTNSFRTKI